MANEIDISIATAADTSGLETVKTGLTNVEKIAGDTTGLDKAKKGMQEVASAAKLSAQEIAQMSKAFGISQNNYSKFGAQANQAGSAINGVKNQVAPLAESFSSMGAAINLVNPQMGMMVQGAGALTNGMKGLLSAFKVIATSPIALAIIAATAAFAALRKKLDEARAALKELVADMGKVPGIAERNAKVKRAYDEMTRSIEKANDALAHQRELEDMTTANLRGQQDAQQEARKQRELAGAADEEQRQEIEDRYAREGIKANDARRKEDIDKEAERVYSETDKTNYEEMRKQSQKEIVAQKANIADIKEKIRDNKSVQSGEIKTGSSYWEWMKSGFTDSSAINKEDQKEAAKNIKDLTEQLKDAEAALAAMTANAEKNAREENQAKEKRAKILEGINAVEDETKAREEALNTQIKAREDAENEAREKAREDAGRGVAEVLKADEKQGAEWQWGRDYEQGDAATKKKMLEAKIKNAQGEAKKAKADMDAAANGDMTDEENKRRLADAQARFTESRSVERSAQSSLDALNKIGDSKGHVNGIKLSDRISAMGGFSTAGAKAVSGISAMSPDRQRDNEIKKQTELQKESRDSLKKIESNTGKPANNGGAVATFA